MRLKLPLILALFLCVSGTWARKVVVTSTGDDASNPVEGMLRYHINNAQTGDTIVFNVNQVTLQGEISIASKTLVIDGEAGVTIDANESGRIFNITSYSRNALLVIKNLKLINGKLSSSLAMGGAMRVHLASGEVLVENCIFESNTVESSGDGQGGALRTNGGTFINCAFINNRVTGSTSILGGGGVFAIGNSRFVNCVVAGNTASYAGGISSSDGVEFINCTIAFNTTPEADKGGGISNEGGILTNCILWGNTAGGLSNNVKHYSGSYTHCAMETGDALATGSNIGLSDSPFVSDSEPFDLSLLTDSECVDAGTVDGLTPTDYDIAGKDRIRGNTIDIGAYEYPLPPLAVPVAADFSSDVTSGHAPLTILFTDASTGDATSWAWDFNNDGVVDAVTQNPEYTFNEPGEYTVTLTASNDISSDQVVKTDFIRVDDPTTGLADRSTTAFGMYPNPTSGRLHIVAPEGAAPIQSIEVVNLSGALVMVIDGKDFKSQAIDVSHLHEGAVFVRIVCQDRVITQKLLISKP